MASNVTVQTHIRALLARTRHRYATSTLRAYAYAARHYLGPLADLPLAAVTPDDVRAQLDTLALTLSPRTVRWVRNMLSGWLEDAVEAGAIPSNPARQVKSTRYRGVPAPRLVLGRDELATLLRHLQPTRSYVPALVCARAGLRPGEAVGLHAEDVDCDRRQLTVRRQRDRNGVELARTKTGTVRVVDMSGQLTIELAGAVRQVGTGPLWPKLTRRNFLDDIHRATARAGLPNVTPHSLRHSFASLLIADGVSPAYVQRMLGHRSIDETIRTYGSHIPWRDLEAVDRLDGASRKPTLGLVPGRTARRAYHGS